MQAIQMNTRIDASLKKEGDLVLGSLGLTPSQAVRGLWRFMVARRDEPDAIREVIGEARTDDKIAQRLEVLAEGRRLCIGLGPLASEISVEPYENLRAGAYAQRFEECG